MIVFKGMFETCLFFNRKKGKTYLFFDGKKGKYGKIKV